MEEVGAAFRPLRVETSGPFAVRIVTLGDFFREVIPVLFEAVSGVQVGLFGTVCDGGEVTDTKVNACCLVTGCSGCLNFVFADEMQFPASFRFVVDSPDLLQILNRNTGASFVFDKDVLPRFGMFLVIRALGQADTVVLGVVTDAILLPRHRTARMFLVNTIAVVVVVVFLAVAGRIRSTVRVSLAVPRVEGFSEFLKNALTGLTVQSLGVVVSLQLGFEVAVVRYLARGFPLLSRVVVGDVVRLCLTGSQTESENVPELAGTPPVPVKRFLYLCVVEDFHSMGSVEF